MPRKARIPECSELKRKKLEGLAHSRTAQARLVERARMVLDCLRGEPIRKSGYVRIFQWWAIGELNPGPPPCQDGPNATIARFSRVLAPFSDAKSG